MQSAAQQTQALTDNLTRALASKAEQLEKLEETNATLKVIRAALQGVQIGQKLEREVIAERVANEPKPETPAA